ncbi:hypothetical protein [Novosphingobium sp.]|uniref:hypothetical protein n=1 Tax=Novosphingobium sp. TaxID=1874826 RepID=UPI0026020AAA|nr:hypothetical protein [Novosphingobium sp.]
MAQKSKKIPVTRDMSAEIAQHERPMRMAISSSYISAVLTGVMLLAILMGEITIATSASLMA